MRFGRTTNLTSGQVSTVFQSVPVHYNLPSWFQELQGCWSIKPCCHSARGAGAEVVNQEVVKEMTGPAAAYRSRNWPKRSSVCPGPCSGECCPHLPVALAPTEPSPSYSVAFGGQLWRRIQENLWPPVWSGTQLLQLLPGNTLVPHCPGFCRRPASIQGDDGHCDGCGSFS